MFKIRNLAKHLKHCRKVEAKGNVSSRRYGVNRRSVLLELRYFDMCSGALVPDVMHDVLEGKYLIEI